MQKINDTELIKDVEILFLVENSVYTSKLFAEHGLAIYLRGHFFNGKEFKVLFDTGQTGISLINNIKNLKVDLTNLDGIVFSHGHYDHTGGIKHFLESYNDNVKIYCHPEVFKKKYSVNNQKKRDIGLPFNRKLIESLGGIFKEIIKPTQIVGGIFTTGEIERTNDFEKVPNRFKKLEDGELIQDDIIDDLALILNTPEGTILVTGCGHSGVVNTIHHSLKISNSNKVLGLFGGFHLIDANFSKVNTTIDNLKKIDIETIGACHCTGPFAASLLINEYVGQYRYCSTGVKLVFKF